METTKPKKIELDGTNKNFVQVVVNFLNNNTRKPIIVKLKNINDQQMEYITQAISIFHCKLISFACLGKNFGLTKIIKEYDHVFKDCKKLYLNETKLTELPDLPKCKLLKVMNSTLVRLPSLPKCEKLICSQNRIKELPYLPVCETLDCSDNDLVELVSLPNVKSLKCKNNFIQVIGEINNVIKILDISNNPLTVDCEEIRLLNPSLKELKCNKVSSSNVDSEQLSHTIVNLFTEFDNHLDQKPEYQTCFDLNRFPLAAIFEKMKQYGVEVGKMEKIIFEKRGSIPDNSNSIFFDDIDVNKPLKLSEGTTIIRIHFKLSLFDYGGHSNIFVIRKDGNEISTIYIEPHGKYKKKGIFLPNSDVDLQEMLRQKLELLVENSYPNSKFNHFGIQSKIRLQYQDKVGYCDSLALMICYFSFIINNCNVNYCEEVSNKVYIEKMITILEELTQDKLDYRYRGYCRLGKLLCEFNIFFFCFLIYNEIISVQEGNLVESPIPSSSLNYSGYVKTLIDLNVCQDVYNDQVLREIVMRNHERIKKLVLTQFNF